MGDVDAAGILYFASPYRWLEELLSGWFFEIGHPLSSLLHGGTGCPSVASAAQYLAPVGLDDHLDVALYPSGTGTTSFSITAIARRARDDDLAVKVSSWHTWSRVDHDVGTRLRPMSLPDWLHQSLAAATAVEPASPKHKPSQPRGETCLPTL